ncbi:MAG TPA: DUF948 domain-containing protein [Candidatus Polarisedimenticolaceae bacterium]|nr:DUF948 domain-containing protein [Candidatus Polarisedimenticolaceae bacterium]
MPASAVWILVALAAILVGAAVPALLQLRRTLKVAEETLTVTGRKADELFAQISTTVARINATAEQLDHGVQRASSLFEAVGGIGDALQGLRASVGAFASIGSTVIAAVSGLVGGLFARREPKAETAIDEASGG